MGRVTTMAKASRAQEGPKQEKIRVCRRCMTGKPLSEYYGAKNSYGTVHRECKECHKRTVWERKWGVVWADYERRLREQDNRCAVCQITLDEWKATNRRVKEFCIDHCHKTGKHRGLLCADCNRAIGMLQDSPTICRRAAEYIESKR